VNDRARHTANTVRVYRSIGVAKAPRKRVPKPLRPVAIERAYGKAINELLGPRIRAAYAPLLSELPRLIDAAAHERRVDAEWDESAHPRAADGKFGEGGGTSSAKPASGGTEHAATVAKVEKPFMPVGLKGVTREQLALMSDDDIDAAIDREEVAKGKPSLMDILKRGQADKAARTAKVKDAMAKSPAVILTDKSGNETLMIQSGETANPDEGAHRLSFFAKDGPLGHATRVSVDKLVEKVAIDYDVASARPATDDDVLAWTSTPEFAAGSQRVAEVQKANAARHTRKDAGESRRLQELLEQAAAILRNSITARELEQLVERFGQDTSRHQRIQLNRQVKSALGIDIFTADRRIPALIEGFAAENVALIKDITQRIASDVEKATTRALQAGVRHETLALELEDKFGYQETRARLIARDQVGKLYGQIDTARNQELGVTRYIWHNVGDDRVRGTPGTKYANQEPSHYDREGQIFEYANPPEGGNPGEAILCRCWAEAVVEDILQLIAPE
jgi:SPP1 gp7 family putative phage head morphogenesis protein